MKVMWLLALSVAAASPAAAQMTCSRTGNGQVYCQPQPGAGAADAAAAAATAGAEAARQSAAATPAAGPQGYRGPGLIGLFQDARQASRNKHVGKLLADGKCVEAQQYAFREGDLALANYVAQVCAGH